MNLINEHGNETLINSLQGIFDRFSDDLKPYVKELLDSLCKVVLKMIDQEKKTEDEAESSQFSVITSL